MLCKKIALTAVFLAKNEKGFFRDKKKIPHTAVRKKFNFLTFYKELSVELYSRSVLYARVIV
jgi:hypothetical protein